MITRQPLASNLPNSLQTVAVEKVPTAFIAVLCLLLASCGGSGTSDALDLDPNSGGDTSIVNATSNAFATPAPNLDENGLNQHLDGDAEFEVTFVSAGQPVNPGIGPVFNNSACIRCHPKDGRGKLPDVGNKLESAFLRVSLGNDPVTGPVTVPGMGKQLQHRANLGIPPEADVTFVFIDSNGSYSDGTPYALHKPEFTISNPAAASTDLAAVKTSPRVAPPVFGRGLLEAISEADILANADPDDDDGDGISGRANYVLNFANMNTELGRFGLKANTPTLIQQNAGAYVDDMGVTNTFFTVDTASGQVQDDGFVDDPELGYNTSTGMPDFVEGQKILDDVTFYTQTLAVPARRDVNDPVVQNGQRLFDNIGCTACHTPTFTTANSPIAALANQTIHPYSDMLLHDMGEDLADGREDFLANGSEWRTPPLWGIGLTEVVNGHTFFLHDGRARNVAEAILWHGGEAEPARESFRTLSAADREALLRFVNSL